MASRKIDKEQLLLKTSEVFRKKGYYGTSMDDLAKACNLYKASFYYYYPGKEELVCAILAYYLEKLRENLESLFREEIARSERKRKFLDLYMDWSGEGNKGHLFAMLGAETAQTSNDIRVSIRQAYMLWQNYFTQLLTETYLEVEATAIANHMLCELEGAVSLSRIMGDLTYAQEAAQKIISKLR